MAPRDQAAETTVNDVTVTSARPSYFADAARFTWRTWTEMGRRRTILPNLSAGVTVAMVALPLNLALAIACGLPPAVGLVTGAIAGLLAGLLGGSRLQVTGPEVALVPITFEIVSRFGFTGLVVATAIAGVLQIAFGVLRLGRLVNAIPSPVLGGFLAAVGLMVLDSQLPRLFGLPVRLVSDIRDIAVLSQVSGTALLLGAVVIGTLIWLPRLSRRAPAPLVALLLSIGLFIGLGWSVTTVSPIEQVELAFGWPPFAQVDLAALLPDAVVLALVASIDSLLCAISVDPAVARRRADQELVAQGLANLLSACVGGMPVAAAVVRSRVAVDAGATTRLAPLVQCLVLGLILFVLAPFVSYVPIVALASILLVVGFRLIDRRQLLRLWRADRFEALMFVATAMGILLTDFVKGVLIGVAVALIGFARKQGSALRVVTVRPEEVSPESSRTPAAGALVLQVKGPLFFGNMDRLDDAFAAAEGADRVVLDLSGIDVIDASGAAALIQAAARSADRGTLVWLRDPPAFAEPALQAALEQHPTANIRRLTVRNGRSAQRDKTPAPPVPGAAPWPAAHNAAALAPAAMDAE